MNAALRCLAAGLSLMVPVAAVQGAICNVSTTGVTFGTYTLLSIADTVSTGTVVVGCDAVATYWIAIRGGSTGTFDRAMTSGANRLEYNLFTDPARTIVWGDDTGGSSRVGSSGSSGSTHTVYGRIRAKQNVRAGSYLDLLVMTVEF